MKKVKIFLKGVYSYLLTNERINTQRCVAKDIDTTQTIVEKYNKAYK